MSHLVSLFSRRLVLLILIALCVSCRRSEPPSNPLPAGIHHATQFVAIDPEPRPTLFTKLTAEQTGIDFVSRIDADHALSRLYISGFSSGGVAIGDVDGDGQADIYLSNGPGDNRLYRQTSGMRFEDVTVAAGVGAEGTWSAGSSFADVDNDGDLDLYVCSYDSLNRLYLNDGHGTFTERPLTGDAAVVDASVMAHFCDYDLDGDLDFFLLTNRLYRDGGLPSGKITERVNGKTTLLPEYQRYYHLIPIGPRRFTAKTSGRPNRLFENDGTGNFRDVSKQAGITEFGKGLSATWYDYDLDGLPDIYVANDFDDPDHLYHNNGDGTFSDVIRQVVPHTTWFSMGSDCADLNNDGMEDLVVLDMSATSHYRQKVTMGDMSSRQNFMDHSDPRQLMRNTVFLNTGVGRFLEAAQLSGLASSDWSWAVKLADFDNDGWTDVFIANGMTTDMTNADRGLDQSKLVGHEEWEIVRNEPRQRDHNLAFRNDGNLQFHNVGRQWGLDHNGMSYSAAYGDLDRDGDLDLIVTNLDEQVHVYRNDCATGNRISFSLNAARNNRFGIGSRLQIEYGGQRQVRILNPMTGFMSSNEPVVHFGLGDADRIETLSVTWPDGTVQTFHDIEAGMLYEIEEDATQLTPAAPSLDASTAPPTLFASVDRLSALRHRETPYDDFATQPLLPNKMSQLGPGMAVADIDGDGDDDFCIGGAKGDVAKIQLSQSTVTPIADPVAERPYEDLATLLFDADGDGDVDVYVVSGGVENDDDPARLRDRLYLNDGQGRFEAAVDALPASSISGSVVAAADYDRDGDLDLFVGGRQIPRNFPLAPPSQLLRNDSTAQQVHFEDVTSQVADELQSAGMVTSAVWSDVNSDGWVDLLVTTEWGPVRVFLNREGQLAESADSGLASFSGWWNGIASRDLDNDGDIDFVVTNFGLNTKYHPTAGHPTRIYYGKFGTDEHPHIVEAKVVDKHLLPVRGKSCSQNAMPFVRQKFRTYHDFAIASLSDIYSDDKLRDAERFEVNTLESALLMNDGQGSFTVRPLPLLTQLSPAFGVVATEVDGDGNADIYLVQNFYHPQRETGKMAGGLSVLLLGDGAGNFSEVWPQQSGLVVPEDATGLSACDLNDDGRVDFAVAVNDGVARAFQNQSSSGAPIKVRLIGPAGNSTGVGAVVSLATTDGKVQTAEVTAGGSYLSQSTSDLFFGLGSSRLQHIHVRWPDGTESSHTPTADESTVVIRKP